MSRVQLALNVDDVDGAVAFYTQLFGIGPAKRRAGYANFTIADPPLKLVLIENPEAEPGTLNHLGIEVENTREVAAAKNRLAAAGLPTTLEREVECCYALQDKVWAEGPGGARWEIYAVLTDAGAPGDRLGSQPGQRCCASDPTEPASACSCC